MTKLFSELKVGDEFKVVNIASGQVLSDCPIFTKIVPFQWKIGRTVNVKHPERKGSYRFCYEFFNDNEKIVPYSG